VRGDLSGAGDDVMRDLSGAGDNVTRDFGGAEAAGDARINKNGGIPLKKILGPSLSLPLSRSLSPSLYPFISLSLSLSPSLYPSIPLSLYPSIREYPDSTQHDWTQPIISTDA